MSDNVIELFKTREVQDQLIREAEKTHFQSNFKLLNEHNGWRPEKIHLLIAPPGAGKSTFVRSMVLDALNNKGKKVGCYLSEESLKDFFTETAHAKFSPDDFELFYPISEYDLTNKTLRGTFLSLREHVLQHSLDRLFIDNITTMDCYGDSLENQRKAALGFKRLADQLNIPIVIIAHTASNIKEGYVGLIDMNDIRGAKHIINYAQFIYTLQPVFINNRRHTFIFIKKARGQEVKNTSFEMFYFSSAKIFGQDEARSFETFKEIFKQRNKL